MLARQLPVLLASLALSACGVGTLDTVGGPVGEGEDEPRGNDPGGDEDVVGAADAAPEVKDYALTVSPPLGEIELGDQMSFTATLSSDNYAGPVSLNLSGALPSWEVTYSPSQTIDLVEDQITDVLVTITVPTNGDAGSGALSFALDGELGPRTGTASLDVANQVTVAIPAGAGQGGHGIGGNIAVRQGTNVVILNNDSTPHRIHADPHQDGEMGQGESYVLSYDRAGNESAYCHSHGENTGVLLISVE